jgi:2-methylcitrate dehydratase PrpD
MHPIARQLAEWCADLTENDIPAEVLGLVPLRVLDSTGLIVGGSATEAVKAARLLAEAFSGAAQSTVVASPQRLPACAAVLVHGVAAHCHDFDDTFADSVVHPGSVVIPTAIALAEATGAAGDDFRAADRHCWSRCGCGHGGTAAAPHAGANLLGDGPCGQHGGWHSRLCA